MDKSTLISIIKRDELELEEIEIWNNMIKWGIAQEPQLNSNLMVLTRDDLNELKSRLEGILSFVRFFCISGDDFYEKIWPLKKILSKDLINQLVKFHVVKGSNPPTNALSKSLQKLNISVSTVEKHIVKALKVVRQQVDNFQVNAILLAFSLNVALNAIDW